MKAEIKNLKKAARRILKAIKNKERIILYGDADLDGVSSTIILKETIKNLGGQISSIYFPDRENEGYGINEKALNYLKNLAPALFVALDLGIGNFKEAKLAKEIGFELIIIDHHEILDKVPEASIVVDPKQNDDEYPFKGLANVGIVFKLSQILLGEKFSDNLKNSFLELTALGTLADLMPIVDENKIVVEEGLRSLRKTFRPGLKAFFEFLGDGVAEADIFQKIIPALNTSERTNHLNEAYLLLTCSSIEGCRELARNLVDKTGKKQTRIKEIVQEVENRISGKLQEPVIFEGDSSWPLMLAGSVASIVCQRYKKPVFIFKKKEEESCGSVRNPKDMNSVEAMKKCSDFLITFGGHRQASGFRIKNENLTKFKECLIEYFNNIKT